MSSRNELFRYERREGKNSVKITGNSKHALYLAWFDRFISLFSVGRLLLFLNPVASTLLQYYQWMKQKLG
jgi:hypothetical protein